MSKWIKEIREEQRHVVLLKPDLRNGKAILDRIVWTPEHANINKNISDCYS